MDLHDIVACKISSRCELDPDCPKAIECLKEEQEDD